MILAGGPARETESAVFRLHREGLEVQGCEVEHEVVPPIVDEAREFVGGGSRWPGEAVRRVARCRQGFMERAREYDGLFMVDTDVVCGPGVLDRLMAVDADVVYGVFWSIWPGWEQPMPQVWDLHPYGYRPETLKSLVEAEFRARRGEGVTEVEVYGGGACTLFRGRAFESRYWPLMRGLETDGWYGEDRTYCVGLEARGIRQVAVVGLPIVHLYTPGQQTLAALAEARERVGLKEAA